MGRCRAGYRICKDDREAFGDECKYEILPAAKEDCKTQEDDDCNGTDEEDESCECTYGAVEPCYDGPEGTVDIGQCASGRHACTDGVWGACDGEALPAQEDCTNLIDEDCDGISCAAPLWGLLSGDGAEQRVTAVVADATGDTYVAGYFAGSLDFGGQALEAKGGSDAFVVKLDAKGAPIWSRSFGTSAEERATVLAATPDGGVIVGGTFTADLPLGQTLLTNGGGRDAFAAKLDGTTGDVQWAMKRGYDGNQEPRAAAVTSEGEIVLVGAFTGYLDCTNGTCGLAAIESAGGADAFVVHLDANGVALGQARFGGSSDDEANAVVLDASGHAIVIGQFAEGMMLGDKALSTSGPADTDIFVATLAVQDLAVSEVLKLGDDQPQTASAGAWAGDGVLLGGTTAGVIDLGFGTVGEAGSKSAFVAKLGPSPEGSWARWFAAPKIDLAGIARGWKGRVALTGSYGGEVDFGSGPLSDGKGTNAFLVQLGADGATVWAKSFGRPEPAALDVGRAVAAAPNGEVVFGGSARSAFDFGLGEVAAHGSFDAAVARFSP